MRTVVGPSDTVPGREHGEELGTKARDALAGCELGEIGPVHAYIREHSRRTAELRVHTPVRVGLLGQPVLQVRAVKHGQGAGFVAAHPLANLAHDRVVAIDEGNGCNDTCIVGEAFKSLGLGYARREGLLADDVFACGYDVFDQRSVQIVGHAHVDDIHLGVGDQVLRPFEDPVEAQILRQRNRARRQQVSDPDQAVSSKLRRPGVHATDEACSDDSNSKRLSHVASLSHETRPGAMIGGGICQAPAAEKLKDARLCSSRKGIRGLGLHCSQSWLSWWVSGKHALLIAFGKLPLREAAVSPVKEGI